MRALYVILPVLGILAIAYRYYSAFLAAKDAESYRRPGLRAPRRGS